MLAERQQMKLVSLLCLAGTLEVFTGLDVRIFLHAHLVLHDVAKDWSKQPAVIQPGGEEVQVLMRVAGQVKGLWGIPLRISPMESGTAMCKSSDTCDF